MFSISPSASQRAMWPYGWRGKSLPVGACWHRNAQTTTADAVNCFQRRGVRRAGSYRLAFDTASYYEAQKIDALYPVVEVTFRVRAGDSQLHIPVLLTPNGYTTYRGS